MFSEEREMPSRTRYSMILKSACATSFGITKSDSRNHFAMPYRERKQQQENRMVSSCWEAGLLWRGHCSSLGRRPLTRLTDFVFSQNNVIKTDVGFERVPLCP